MKLYMYDKCSTCIKAKKFLDEKNVSYTKMNIIETPPTKEELGKIVDEFGVDIDKVFNTRGVKYRELGLKDKLNDMSLDEKKNLLISDGKLVKRPILLSEEGVLLGFNEKNWAIFLIENKIV